MYILKTDAAFDSAHFLSGYEGKCSNIHGHRWVVAVEVESESLENSGTNRGMIVDFKQLKASLKVVTEEFDHSLIIEKGSLKETTLNALLDENFKIITLDFRPTAENLAKYFFDKMKETYNMRSCTVYETPKNCATYCE